MTGNTESGVTISIPLAARRLPRPDEDVDAILEEVVTAYDLKADRAARLLESMRAVTAWAHARTNPNRAYFALIGLPATGNVDAVLSVATFALREEDTPEAYEAKARRSRLASDPASPALRYEVSRATIGDLEAVVTYQFELPEGGGGQPAAEQATVALFVDESTMIEYRVVAQDLAVFSDIVAYTVGLTATGVKEKTDDV